MKIHVDFPLAAAEALKKAGVGSTEKSFTFVYVSGEGADPSEKSMFMWARGKVCPPSIGGLVRLWTYNVRRAVQRQN